MDVSYMLQFHKLMNANKEAEFDEDGNVIELKERKEPIKSQRQLFFLDLKNKKKNNKKKDTKK